MPSKPRETEDPPYFCNPLGPPGQQGCAAGLKCTWVRLRDEPEPFGTLRCVPDGTVSLGAACSRGPAGETTGYDDCAAGLYCIEGACQEVCGLYDDSTAVCPSGFTCTRYADTFSNADNDPVAGICNPACDPLTQTKILTPTEGCGTGNGCYVLTSQTTTIAVCARAGTVAHEEDIAGQAYPNSCVPGAQPRSKDPTSPGVQCGGLCRVVDVYTDTNTESEGGEATVATTDIDTCQDTWGAAPPSDGTAGESCRYWWAREPFTTLSPHSNTLGWCFKHSAFLYDSDNDFTPDRPFPRCTSLTTGDVEPPIGDPPHNDAEYFWCVAAPPPMLQNAIRGIKANHVMMEPKIDRLVDHSHQPPRGVRDAE